jgi:bifunctional non-homologous end joining protein LigD
MATALDEYNRKRNFQATPEPSGAPQHGQPRPTQALQFCIQKHDASHLHYDFRLELDGTLKSWAVPKGPSLDPTARRLAVHVEDHPLDYAGFEGHIPEGHYGAGDVIVWDRGSWVPEGDPREGYAKGKLKFTLHGEKLGGAWHLVKTSMPGKKEQWFLIKSKDAEARAEAEYRVVDALPDSVLSDRSLPSRPAPTPKPKKPRAPRKAAGKPMPSPQAPASPRPPDAPAVLVGARAARLPAMLEPQLATLVAAPPAGDWRYELKFDGYRLLARVDGEEVRLFTRSGNDWTDKMPQQAAAIAALKLHSGWLDGEVVVADEHGVPSFQALQNAFEAGKSGLILYYLFDLPFLNGMDLRQVPLEQRRAALAEVLTRHPDGLLRYSDDFAQAPEALLDSARQLNMEGLIGKRVGSAYVSNRGADWIKLKCQRRQEFVIVGFTDPKGSRTAFGALLLGLHTADGGELRYAGKVGTGFDQAALHRLLERLEPLQRRDAPLANPPTGAQARGVHWLQPQLLAEVAFAEMTRDGLVRHAVFQGLREDKPAERIGAESPATTLADAPVAHAEAEAAAPARPKRRAKAASDQVRITHPERVIDPSSGSTKMQLAEYYARVTAWILPHLQQRPVALVRAPEGIKGELFFQKHLGHLTIPGVVTFDKATAGQAAMVIDTAEALIGAVQMGALEFHTWNATAADFQHPDRFTLDLDPDPALPWKSMLEATQLVLAVLDELGLQAFLKTSGGKGIHVVVPLTPKGDWAAVKDFSHAIVDHIAALLPERFAAVAGPKNRVGKIFIDYLRNGLGATTACAFGARAREGLPVSMPIHREELAGLEGADQWTVATVHERLETLADDPWADFFDTRQTLTAAMRKRLRR